MTNEELLDAGMKMMENQTAELIKIKENQTAEILKMKGEIIRDVTRQVTENMSILLETKISKKIDTLFDGHEMNSDRLWELEHRTDRLESRVGALEEKAG